MPKSKHRRKAGGKSVAHPGRIGGPTPPRSYGDEDIGALLDDAFESDAPEEAPVEGQGTLLDALRPPPAQTEADED
jgi:hypothetical protein